MGFICCKKVRITIDAYASQCLWSVSYRILLNVHHESRIALLLAGNKLTYFDNYCGSKTKVNNKFEQCVYFGKGLFVKTWLSILKINSSFFTILHLSKHSYIQENLQISP